MDDVASSKDRTARDANGASVQIRCRPNLFNPELLCRLEDDAVVITHKAKTLSVRYTEIVSVSVFPVARRSFGGQWRQMSRCMIRTGTKAHLIQSSHFTGWGRFEDRTKDYQTFVTHLLRKAGRANPALVVLAGMPFGTWLGWLVTAVVCAVLGVAGLFILPAGLALTIGCLAAFPSAWTMLNKGYSHPVDPATVLAEQPDR